MIDFILKYLNEVSINIPSYICVGLVAIFCIGAILVISLYGYKKGLRYSCSLLIAEYVFVLMCSTVLFRPIHEKHKHDFRPFWSYEAIHEGRSQLLLENVMNVVAFVPIGLLLGCGFRNMTWWKVLLIGCIVSVSIETMQFYFKRGFAETDDVMHNVLGCLIGYFLVKGGRCVVKI